MSDFKANQAQDNLHLKALGYNLGEARHTPGWDRLSWAISETVQSLQEAGHRVDVHTDPWTHRGIAVREALHVIIDKGAYEIELLSVDDGNGLMHELKLTHRSDLCESIPATAVSAFRRFRNKVIDVGGRPHGDLMSFDSAWLWRA